MTDVLLDRPAEGVAPPAPARTVISHNRVPLG